MTPTTPTPALAELDLPPLPPPFDTVNEAHGEVDVDVAVFSVGQMVTYARDAIAASRRVQKEPCK